MKKKLLIFFLLISSQLMATGTELSSLRSLMAEAYLNESAAQNFYNSTRNISTNSRPIMLGFKAIAELMMCKHLSNPLTKLSYFNKGRKHLEQAISVESNNPELRFMRFCTQVNAPDLLGYNTSVKTDKIFLIEYLKTENKLAEKQDPSLYVHVKKFLLNTRHCSTEEKNLIKQL
jgi:hypothetical protein